MAMKFEYLRNKFIKPLVPTPQNLRNYKLGFIDELAPPINVAIVLFFAKKSNHNPKLFVVQLEKSLEKVLTRLYPLAGRYVEETQIVECNDEGAEFIEAEVNVKLEDILGPKADVTLADEFIPMKTKHRDFVLTIQLTTFECGGVALGVSVTHKVVDASTLCTFLNEWAAINREENELKFTGPGFISSSLFPGCCLPPSPTVIITDDDTLSKYTRKKLSFNESAISEMKAKAITSVRLSKVQLVLGIICKALIGVDRVTHGYRRETVVVQTINLRERLASPIPKDSCGNLWGIFGTRPTNLETTEELANHIHDSIKNIVDYYSKVHHDSEQGQTMVLKSFLKAKNPNLESMNLIQITSWCKFPFYEVDFGFGKPIQVVPWNAPVKKFVLLMDGPGGNGVEAYISLEVKDAPYFEAALDVHDFDA